VQRAVEVRFRRCPKKRPYGAGENSPPKVSIADEGVLKELLAIVVNKSIGQHPRKHYRGHQRQHGAGRIGVVLHILVALAQQGLTCPPQLSGLQS
jgi:hypothetical protein